MELGSDVKKTATPKTQDKAEASSPTPRQGQDTNQHDQDKTRSSHCNTKQDQGKACTKMQTKTIVTHVFSVSDLVVTLATILKNYTKLFTSIQSTKQYSIKTILCIKSYNFELELIDNVLSDTSLS